MVIRSDDNMTLQTVNWADAFALLSVAELVCVAMAAAEAEGHTATDVVVVVPPGDWDTTRSRVHRQRAHICRTRTTCALYDLFATPLSVVHAPVSIPFCPIRIY